MSRALELCFAQLGLGKSRQQIADAIGYSRPAVSLFMGGNYGANVKDIEAAILKTFDRRECPHTAELVDPATCHKKALSPKPFGGATRLAWWSACQSCPHKPEAKGVQK